jgi:hypothetical protein
MAKTTWRTLATAGLMAIGWTGTEPAVFGASAQDGGSVVLKVLVDNDAGVSADVLGWARKETTRLFGTIDVEVAWLDPRAVHRGDAADLRAVIVAQLVGREMTDRMHAAATALGISAGTALATMFYDRIEELSFPRDPKDMGCLLGHVMAHEIGHLLLRSRSHSASGIMHPRLDVQLARRGMLFFSSSEARQIRATLGGP